MSNEVAVKEFETIKAELIAAYDTKGMRASGKFAESLEVISAEDRIMLIGEDYAQQLETGRQAGKFPPLQAIKDWIEAKGVFAEALQTISLSSLAFLIARKIAKQGWKREGFGGVNLVSDIVTEERIQKIIDQEGAALAVLYTSEIVRLLKDLK